MNFVLRAAADARRTGCRCVATHCQRWNEGSPSCRTACMRSRSGRVLGKSERTWAPRRLLAQQRATRDGASERVLVGRQALEAGAIAHQPGVAPQRLAGLPGRHGDRLGRRRSPGAGAGSSSAARAARSPKTTHSRQRVRGQAVGAVQPRARGLADDVEAGHAGGAVQVAGDAAHHVVRGGSDGNELASPDRGPRRAARRRRSESAPGRRARMSSDTDSTARACISSQIARATSSRGASSSTKRSPSGVEQRRALTANRLGHEEALAARRSP